MKQLTDNHREIANKQSLIQKLEGLAQEKQEFRDSDVQQRIDFTPVEEIFDDLWAEDIGSMFFSVVNLTMVGVILVSGFLWFKLDTYEKNN